MFGFQKVLYFCSVFIHYGCVMITRLECLDVPATLVEEAVPVGYIPHPSAAMAGLHCYLTIGVREVGGAANPYWHRAVASSEDRFFAKKLYFCTMKQSDHGRSKRK